MKNQQVKRDVYQEVTDKVIAALEKGTMPWHRPWRSAVNHHGGIFPSNALTGNFYSGVNVLLLWLAAEEQGYCVNRWLTFRQAQQLGGSVRKGETSTLAVIYKPFEVPAEDKAGNPLFDDSGKPLMVQRSMLKANPLFNIAQCDGLPEHLLKSGDVIPDEEKETLSAEICNRVIAMYQASGVGVTFAPQDRAYYSPSKDSIVMPVRGQFFTEADYWSTLLHEMVHSTGHSTRLNREGITSSSRKFGDPVYSFEELIAEMGSAFLCAQLEVLGEVNHESYIEHWLGVLREDKKALFRACKQAREASEFLLNLSVSDSAKAA